MFTKERVLGLQKMLNDRKATRKYIEGANGSGGLAVLLCADSSRCPFSVSGDKSRSPAPDQGERHLHKVTYALSSDG